MRSLIFAVVLMLAVVAAFSFLGLGNAAACDVAVAGCVQTAAVVQAQAQAVVSAAPVCVQAAPVVQTFAVPVVQVAPVCVQAQAVAVQQHAQAFAVAPVATVAAANGCGEAEASANSSGSARRFSLRRNVSRSVVKTR